MYISNPFTLQAVMQFWCIVFPRTVSRKKRMRLTEIADVHSFAASWSWREVGIQARRCTESCKQMEKALSTTPCEVVAAGKGLKSARNAPRRSHNPPTHPPKKRRKKVIVCWYAFINKNGLNQQHESPLTVTWRSQAFCLPPSSPRSLKHLCPYHYQ